MDQGVRWSTPDFMMLFQYRLSTPSSRKQEVLAVAGSPLAYDEGRLSLPAYEELSKLSRHRQRKTLALSSRKERAQNLACSHYPLGVGRQAATDRLGVNSLQDYRIDPREDCPPLVGAPLDISSDSAANSLQQGLRDDVSALGSGHVLQSVPEKEK
jgi:hypothetical protein